MQGHEQSPKSSSSCSNAVWKRLSVAFVFAFHHEPWKSSSRFGHRGPSPAVGFLRPLRGAWRAPPGRGAAGRGRGRGTALTEARRLAPPAPPFVPGLERPEPIRMEDLEDVMMELWMSLEVLILFLYITCSVYIDIFEF